LASISTKIVEMAPKPPISKIDNLPAFNLQDDATNIIFRAAQTLNQAIWPVKKRSSPILQGLKTFLALLCCRRHTRPYRAL
jgi:hypothetical protein